MESSELRHWFILNDSKVTGPFSKSEIDHQIASQASALIWGRGQSEWVNHGRWQKLLSDFEENHRRQKLQSERLWKVSVAGEELTPMNQQHMMDLLKSKTDLNDILIWTEGYSEWKEIYQIHKIMDELGVSRRQHPRVPIMGTLTCEGASGSFEARVLSVSEGGLGVTDTPPIKIGEKFKTILKSPNLFTPIHATAEIVYLGNDGYAGLKFIGLHSESKSALIEYVKKFQDASGSPSGQR
jgi:hypothetical protein